MCGCWFWLLGMMLLALFFIFLCLGENCRCFLIFNGLLYIKGFIYVYKYLFIYMDKLIK